MSSPAPPTAFAKSDKLWKQLRPLQKRGVEFVVENPSAGLLFQQRLGKTWIACGAIERLAPERTLIVAKLNNKESTWADLIRKNLSIPLTTAVKKLKKKQLIALVKSFKRGILLIHTQAMVSVIKWLRKIAWDFVVIDESQDIKDKSSKASRAAAKLAYAPRKLLLSGTPIENDPKDAWAQFRFLAPNVFGTRWLDFDEEYMEQCDIDPFKYPRGSFRRRQAFVKLAIAKRKLGFREDMLPKFLKLVKPFLWREELPSPEPNITIEWVDMRGEQRRLYRELESTGVTRLEDGTRIMTTMEMMTREKLQQICGGFVFDDDKNVYHVGRAKLRALKRIVAHRKRPGAIFCRYMPEIDMIRSVLTGKVGVLSGQVKRDERERVKRDFQAGRLDYIICQIRTGGVGIDLYRAAFLAVYSMTYSFIDWDQMLARIRLPEQKVPGDVILLLCSDSVDMDKRNLIVRKDQRVGQVLSHLRRRQ